MNLLATRRLWAALFVVVVFLLGVGTGVVGARWFHVGPPFGGGLFGRPGGPPPHHGPRGGPGGGPRGGPPATPAAMASRMTQELGLTAAQQQQIEQIFTSGAARLETLQTTTQQQFETLRTQLDTEIEAVLTPDQVTKFRARHRDRGPRRPPPPPPE